MRYSILRQYRQRLQSGAEEAVTYRKSQNLALEAGPTGPNFLRPKHRHKYKAKLQDHIPMMVIQSVAPIDTKDGIRNDDPTHQDPCHLGSELT